jgi:serine/threonine-protein kinase
LFGYALDLPPAEREIWLRMQCAGDEALFDAVARMLRADAAAGLLDGNVAELAEPLVTAGTDSGAADHVGKRFGPYRIERLLGQGGMGSVWLAQREDGFAQQVAIKLIAGVLPTRDAVQRFERERQILASLQHPGIARVFDGGSADGTAWFAMEFVEGLALDEFLRRSPRGLNDRLTLFAKIVDAVQFAHQNLVVHRDLKPSNILVTANGEPRLLDFGVAKLLDEGNDLSLSRAPLSVAYAAPEQILGMPITTATDVYSLGVLLYEMLTGSRPHKARGNGSLALVQAITATDPEPPSRVLGQATLRGKGESRRIKGDLDTIVLKCLSRDPQRRYASAQALGDDIGAFLQQRPIRARPESWHDRSGKFLRRHPLSSTLLALSLASVCALAVYSTIQARAAEAGRVAAAREAARATAVQDFLLGLFDQQRPDAAGGAQISAKDLLDRAELRLTSESGFTGESRDLLTQTLARLRYDLGDFEAAVRLENARVAALAQSAGEQSSDYALALIERSGSLVQVGKSAEALADCERALPLLERAPASTARLNALIDCAAILRDEEHYDAAAQLLDQGAELVAQNPSVLVDGVARVKRGHAMLAFSRGDTALAVALNSELIDVLRADGDAALSDLSTALHSRAASHERLGATHAAIKDYREALAVHHRVFGPRHFLAVSTQASLAVVLGEVGELAESRRMMSAALALAREIYPADSPTLALTLSDAAVEAFRRLDLSGAGALLEESIGVNTRAYGPAHRDTLALLNNLSTIQRKLGRFEAARQTARDVLARLGTVDPAGDYNGRQARARLATIALALGDAAALGVEARWLVHALEGTTNSEALELPEAVSFLAYAQVLEGDAAVAKATGERLEGLLRGTYEPGTLQHADGLAACAAIALDIGEPERALALAREALGDAPIAVASWNRSLQLRAALVHFRALHALGRDAENAPWVAPLRERRSNAPADEARDWKAVEALL